MNTEDPKVKAAIDFIKTKMGRTHELDSVDEEGIHLKSVDDNHYSFCIYKMDSIPGEVWSDNEFGYYLGTPLSVAKHCYTRMRDDDAQNSQDNQT